MLGLFMHPGWRILSDEAEEAIRHLSSTALDRLTDERGLYFAKGELARLRSLVNLPDGIRRQLDELDDAEEV